MNKIAVAALGVAVVAGAVWYGLRWRDTARVDSAIHDATAVFQKYDTAFKSGSPADVIPLMTKDTITDAEGPANKPELFQLARAVRPPDVRVTGATLKDGIITLTVTGTVMDEKATGTILLRNEGGAWKVDKENWKVSVDVSGEVAQLVELPLAPPIQAIVDRIASSDPVEGAKAWMELGARYQDPKTYLAETRAGFSDSRAVSFPIVQETFEGGAQTIHYFTAGAIPIGAAGTPAATVGETLRFHLWQLEGLSLGAQSRAFADWWPGYAAAHGLPAGWSAGR